MSLKFKPTIRHLAVALLVSAQLSLATPLAIADASHQAAPDAALTMSYRRLLPLEGGSNFRDLGGYKTRDGKTLVRGKIFRSGAMSSLTAADQDYLNRFGFNAVVDLRSREEVDLFPNTWATKSQLNYLRYDYSSSAMMGHLRDDKSPLSSLEQLYRHFPTQLKPQLKIFFEALLANQTPLVVNCSAGQDRTGITSALLLTALGVPRDVVVEDYLLSTDFRRPDRELGDVNLEQAAKTNSFAKMMLAFNKSGHGGKANPLVTAEGEPFLLFALDEIEKTYGSVANYLDQEIGVSDADLVRLKTLYLQ